MKRLGKGVALAAASAAMLIPVGVAQADSAGSTFVCHGTGSGFVLIQASDNSAHLSGRQYSTDFPYNTWYASCAEQYADLGNH